MEHCHNFFLDTFPRHFPFRFRHFRHFRHVSAVSAISAVYPSPLSDLGLATNSPGAIIIVFSNMWFCIGHCSYIATVHFPAEAPQSSQFHLYFTFCKWATNLQSSVCSDLGSINSETNLDRHTHFPSIQSTHKPPGSATVSHHAGQK